jgi:hypothetical protein
MIVANQVVVGKFINLIILHAKAFGSLDQQLRQCIRTVLQYLADIRNKMLEVMVLHHKGLGLHEREGFIGNHKDELAQVATCREEARRNDDTRLLQVLWFLEISHRHVKTEEAHKKHLHGFSRTTPINPCALFLQAKVGFGITSLNGCESMGTCIG